MFKFWSKKAPVAFNDGYIDSGDGHQIYFHEYGNKNGDAILVFHGGPGSFSKPKHAAVFNLKKYHVILFDQRGAGKSTSDDKFKNNNTQGILRDAKAILDALKISTVKIVSGSWGSALGLLFAEQYPEMVSKMIVYSVFLGRKQDINWISHGTKLFYPDLFQYIKVEPQEDFMRWNYEHIFSDSIEEQDLATKKFDSYERNLGSLTPYMSMKYEPLQDHRDGFKLYMHYLYHDMFLSENQILNNVSKIKDIPVTIVQNRIDMITPLEGAWDLHKALPQSKLMVVSDLGHATDKQMAIVKQLAADI